MFPLFTLLLPGWEINMRKISKCKLKRESGRLMRNIECHYSFFLLATSLGAALKCATSSPMHHLLSQTTLDVLCLLISETTRSHLAASSPPPSCPASAPLEKERPWKVESRGGGRGCRELNRSLKQLPVLCSEAPLLWIMTNFINVLYDAL